MKVFFNKILKINLRAKTFKKKTIPGSVNEIYLGRKRLLSYFLMKKKLNGINPLSLRNKLILFSYPITDYSIYGSSDIFLASSLSLNKILEGRILWKS